MRRPSVSLCSMSVILWSPVLSLALADGPQPRLVLKGHQAEVTSIAFSPDGKRLATASGDRTVKIWDLETGKEVNTLKGHGNYVNSACFSPDGKLIATGSEDKTVRI